MGKKTIFLLLLFLLNGILSAQSISNNINKFEYLSPRPGSHFINPGNNIVLRYGEILQNTDLSGSRYIEVSGSLSGSHTGVFYRSDDNRTLVFLPSTPFSLGETVTVNLKPGLKTITGKNVDPVSYSFFIKNSVIPAVAENTTAPVSSFSNRSTSLDFPALKVDTVNNPYNGKIFIANKPAVNPSPYGNFLIIADNDGSIIKSKEFGTAESNFRVLPNGMLMTSENGGRHIILDTTLAPVDTFKAGNGYVADSHDFLLLPNGHAVLFANEVRKIDMSKIVTGGRSDASVIGAVVQELDASKNVIFQWNTFDYVPITNSYQDLTAKSISYVHGNALDVDNDGNILFSLRYTSSILKINRKTGALMWTLGGKANDFTFIHEHDENAPTYFSNQHNMTMLPDEHLLLFDNGDDHRNSQNKYYSRGVEYKLDEQAKTATMVWEFDHNKDIQTPSGGSVQRLPNGNTIIGWSRPPDLTTYHPIFTEVNDTTIVQEISFADTNKQFSYRAFKFPWVSRQSEYTYQITNVIQGFEGNTYPNPNNPDDDTVKIGVHIKFNKLYVPDYSDVEISRYNYSPLKPGFSGQAPLVAQHYFKIENLGTIDSADGQLFLELKYFPGVTDTNTIVYVRKAPDSLFVPLSTSYNSSYKVNTTENGKVLLVDLGSNCFGDFLFGIPQTVDSSYAPATFTPQKADTIKIKPIEFRWGTKGIFSTFHLQISQDSTFTNILTDATAIDTSGFKKTVFTDTTLSNGNKYFWRVSSTNSAGTSDWSDTSYFYISDTAKIVGVEENNTVVKDYRLSQNYPNPFNPATIIEYSVPQRSLVTLKIYDMLGREIKTLVKEEKSAGVYRVNFNASGLASGVYFYRMSAGNFSMTKKLVLLK